MKQAPIEKGEREIRAGRIEIRSDSSSDDLVIEGYAATFETPYDVAGGPPYGWSEVIAPGAFTKTLHERDDVRLLANHEGIPAARTKSGTLELAQDDIGLHVSATLDRSNPTVAELASALERGDLDEMSFAFSVVRQEWSPDYETRRILEVKLYDVSLVTYPANPATHVQIARDAELIDVEPRGSYPLGLAMAEADALRLK